MMMLNLWIIRQLPYLSVECEQNRSADAEGLSVFVRSVHWAISLRRHHLSQPLPFSSILFIVSSTEDCRAPFFLATRQEIPVKELEMADNGVEDHNVEVADFFDTGKDAKVNELIQRINSLELEKAELVRARYESNEKVGELFAEIDRLRSGKLASKEELKTMEGQIESAEEGNKAIQSILKRARELEIEASRLQHELGSAMRDREVAELKAVVEAKWRMVERLETDVENLKTGKAENDAKVMDLESKIGVLEEREMEGKSEKLWIESELKETIVAREKEVGELKNTIEGLQAVLWRETSELKKLKKEKMGVKQALRESE